MSSIPNIYVLFVQREFFLFSFLHRMTTSNDVTKRHEVQSLNALTIRRCGEKEGLMRIC